ncbi:MAG: retropepsin-like aspartic protease family protein [Nitrospiraceae bacterium]
MSRCATILTLTLGLASLATPRLVWPAVFHCVDASGAHLYTDNPAEAEHCTMIYEEPPQAQKPPTRPKGGPGEQPPAPSTGADPAMSPSEAFAATQPSAYVRVPVLRAGHSWVVQVRLNGTRDAKLILDTGADITVLSYAVVRDLGIVPSASAPTVTLGTVGGSVRADIVQVETISISEAEARNVTAAVHDLPDAPPGVEGLLGMTFLEKFLVTLDSAKGELHLRRR